MEDHEIPTGHVSEWQPITDQLMLAYLGKLGEEVCECGAAIFRCIIQGIHEAEPKTGKINKSWLEDEVADVLALLDHAIVGLDLDQRRIADRRTRKVAFKAPWFASLREPNP